MYTKLFTSLYQGTLRGCADEILVFTNLLAHADINGCVDKHWRAIAEETGISEDRVKAAIVNLESPDPESRSPERDGRRIIPLDEHRAWGWQVVNYRKYRAIKNEDDRREQNRLAQQKWREKQKSLQESQSNQQDTESVSAVSTNKQRKPMQKQKQKQEEGEEKTAPGLEAVADELSILETESAFKIRLDLDTRQRIAKGVPKSVVQFWPAFIQARSVGWTTKPDEAKLRQIGYALTDFQRDHKKIYDQQKPDERLPTLAEKKAAILEQNKTRNEPPAGPLVMPRMQTEGQADSTLITGN